MRRNYRKNPKLKSKIQSTKSETRESVPRLEVAASSISWSSFLVEVSEVAALQISETSRLANESTKSLSMLNEETRVLLLPGNHGNGHLHLGQGLQRLQRRRSGMLRSFFSRSRGGRPRALRQLSHKHSCFAPLDRGIVRELGSPFRARRVDFLLIFFLLFLLLSTRVIVVFVPLSVRLPLLLAFASARLLLFDLFLRPVGH